MSDDLLREWLVIVEYVPGLDFGWTAMGFDDRARAQRALTVLRRHAALNAADRPASRIGSQYRDEMELVLSESRGIIIAGDVADAHLYHLEAVR